MSLEAFLTDIDKDAEITDTLAKLRSSNAQNRRQAQKRLDQFPFVDVCSNALGVLKDASLSPFEKQRVCVYLAHNLNKQSAYTLTKPSSGNTDPTDPTDPTYTTDIGAEILALAPTLFTEEPLYTSAKQLVASLFRVMGITRTKSLTPLLQICERDVRACRVCAECLAIAAATLGVSLLMHVFKQFGESEEVVKRLVFFDLFYFLPRMVSKPSMNAVLEQLLGVAKPILLEDSRIAIPAAKSMAYLLEHLDDKAIPLFNSIKRGLQNSVQIHGKQSSYFLRCLALIGSKERDEAGTELVGECLDSITMKVDFDEYCALHIFVLSGSNTTEQQRNWFFSALYKPTNHNWLVTKVAAQLAPQMDAREFTDKLQSGDRVLALHVLAAGPSTVPGHAEQEVLIRILSAELPTTNEDPQNGPQNGPQNDQNDRNDLAQPSQTSAHTGQTSLLHLNPAITPRIIEVSSKAAEWLARVLDEPSRAMLAISLIELARSAIESERERANKMLAAIADSVPPPQQQLVLAYLNEQLGEEYPEVLGSVLKALERYIQCTQTCDPGLVARLLPVLRNRSEHVQEPLVSLMQTLAEVTGDMVPAREWMRACTELLTLQSSPKVRIRHAASTAFARIAAVIGPAAVAGSLLAQFNSTSRQIRVTAAAAVASIGSETGLFSVLPLLLYTYSTSESENVKQTVLKSVQFAAEFCDDVEEYVDELTGLAQHALLTSSQSNRQTAASTLEAMAVKCVGKGHEPEFVHLLNALMPSIYETSSHVQTRVLAAFKQLASLLGLGITRQYLLAGLFHPARRVRTAYWAAFNEVYKDAPLTELIPLYKEEDIRDVW